RAFQRRHGLNDDGVAGRRTIAALNATAAERTEQVIVSLERLRWMNKELGQRHVHVNLADFTVKLIEDGEVAFQERVVVGKARRHRTPEFSDEMTYMVFNPIWHVPYSIASEEILPKLQEDPEYLLKKNMRLLTRDGALGPDATLHDWSLYSENDFPYLVKQGSGGGNALGRVKFMFPNQFAIYLHDTPSKRLFKKDARAFSHGCVRVQDPMAFARALLAPQTDDPAAFVDRQLARSGERRINLQEPVPVHLTYLTAWVDEAGTQQFRDDVYGRDGRILAALKAEGVAAPGADG
ncbi:MAG: L,D-transpeptidase family protein, partial [Pseudomonadota bacterium]